MLQNVCSRATAQLGPFCLRWNQQTAGCRCEWVCTVAQGSLDPGPLPPSPVQARAWPPAPPPPLTCTGAGMAPRPLPPSPHLYRCGHGCHRLLDGGEGRDGGQQHVVADQHVALHQGVGQGRRGNRDVGGHLGGPPTDTPRHGRTETQTHRDTETRRHGDTETRTHGHADTRRHRDTDTQTHGHTDTQTHRASVRSHVNLIKPHHIQVWLLC